MSVGKGLVSQSSGFGSPLVVNGQRVSDEEIEHHLIYGPGRLQIDLRLMRFAIERELREQALSVARTKHANSSPLVSWEAVSPESRESLVTDEFESLRARHMPSEADLDAAEGRARADFRERHPTLDYEAEMRRTFRSAPWGRALMRETLYFDRVFLPDDPDLWPVTTLEALRADSGQTLVDDARSDFRERLDRARQKGLPPLPADRLFLQMLRQVVHRFAFDHDMLRTSVEGVPEGVLCEIRNESGVRLAAWTQEELWRDVEPVVTEHDVAGAKAWLLAKYATEQSLEQAGVLLGEAEARVRFQQARMTPEGIVHREWAEIEAVHQSRFPSFETFYEHFRLVESFRRLVASPDLARTHPDVAGDITCHRERVARSGYSANVDAEVLLVSAYDFPTATWKLDGRDWAARMAHAIRREIDATAADSDERLAAWTRLFDEHSEVWEPPAPLVGTHCVPEHGPRGRFGPQERALLASLLGESNFTRFVHGRSLTAHLLLDQAVGTIDGPFEGTYGYYLTRVVARTLGESPLNEQGNSAIEEQVLRDALADYARRAVLEARR